MVTSLNVQASLTADTAETLFTNEQYELLFYSDHSLFTSSRSSTSESTIIHTSDGTPVVAYTYEELTEDEIDDLNEYIENHYSDVECLAPASFLYNCHSYAWYNRSESNTYWINYPDQFVYDMHTETISFDELQSGDIVVYTVEECYAHSAVVDYIDENGIIYCISKWGAYGLYSHAIDNVPSTYIDIDGLNVDYFRYEQDAHNYFVFSSDNRRHIFECSRCSNSYSEAHTVEYTDIDPTNHTTICTVCEYSNVSTHNIYYIDLGFSTHKAICNICDYYRIETHTPNNDRTQCIYCWRTGNFTVIVPKNEEDESEIS